MGMMKMWQNGGKKQLLRSAYEILAEPFHIFSYTLLGLLVPLSFLLLARLSTANNHLFPLTLNPHPSSLLLSLFLYSFPGAFHFLFLPLVSLISFAALVHALTGWIPRISKSTEPIFRPRLYAAWILLCTFQVSVCFGIQGSIEAGIDGSGFGHVVSTSWISRVMFFLGLHETMVYWSRTVVKPVVDDTIFGVVKEERWVDRAVMAAGFGAMWWLWLRDEVEWLVVMVEVKKDTSMGVGVADCLGWWMFYQTVTIGLVRFVKGILWVGVILLCRRVEYVNPSRDDKSNEEDRV